MIRRGQGATAFLAVGVLALLIAVPTASRETEAAWADAERATGSFSAGTVNPVTQMTCTAGLGPVRFTFAAPTGGLGLVSYRWTVTGGFTLSGTAAANATFVELTSGLLGIGSATFSLYAVGPGGWESVAKTGQFAFLTGALSSCSVP